MEGFFSPANIFWLIYSSWFMPAKVQKSHEMSKPPGFLYNADFC
jgi:hypothetical protein